MRLTKGQIAQLSQLCEPIPAGELAVGQAVVIDGRRLQASSPMAWRKGVVRALEQSWLSGSPLIPRVDLLPRGSDPPRRKEPVPLQWLLKPRAELLASLLAIGLVEEK
jgi:hypothetical protein